MSDNKKVGFTMYDVETKNDPDIDHIKVCFKMYDPKDKLPPIGTVVLVISNDGYVMLAKRLEGETWASMSIKDISENTKIGMFETHEIHAWGGMYDRAQLPKIPMPQQGLTRVRVTITDIVAGWYNLTSTFAVNVPEVDAFRASLQDSYHNNAYFGADYSVGREILVEEV